MTSPSDHTRWVLLRGLTREAAHWGDFPARFPSALPGAELRLVDLPGNGRWHRRASPMTVTAMTDAVRAQLRAEGVAPPFQLLAMSLGAMVAVDWACRHPGELGGAVLINTSLRPFSPWWQRLQPARLPTLLGLLWPARSAKDREAAVWRLTSRQAPQDELIATWTALREQRPVSTANGLRQLVAAARFRARAAAPEVPLLVLAGRGDRLVDPACSRALAARWNVPLREHPAAGHDLPLDDGAWVVAQVADWWNGVLSGRDETTSAGGSRR